MKENQRRGQDWVLWGMLGGIVAGVVCGWGFGEVMVSFKFLGDLFINALKAVIVPLIMASMICSVAGLGDVRRLGILGGVTVAYYTLTTFIAVLIGLAASNLLQPGANTNLAAAGSPAADPLATIPYQEFHLIDLVMKLVPDNIVQSMTTMDVLPLIVSSLVFGAVLTTLGERGKPVIAFFEGINEAMMRIVQLVMLYAPVGIFGLIAGVLGAKGGGEVALQELSKLGMFVVTVVAGLGLHGLIVLPLIVRIGAKRPPWTYIRNLSSALTTAFSTDSSAATLPMTLECVERKNGVPNSIASFVLPLGATINMDGTAMYLACAAIFIAQAYRIDLSFSQQLIVFLMATLGSVGAAAIPHAGLVMLVMVLSSVGLPLEAIGMIYTVDWFLDRCRTTVNVLGDACGAAVVDRLVSSSVLPDGEKTG